MLLKGDLRIARKTLGIGRECSQKAPHLDANQLILCDLILNCRVGLLWSHVRVPGLF